MSSKFVFTTCAILSHIIASLKGDSGGPLFTETEPNRYEVIGTVSFGDGCARAFPGVYGKVATSITLNWIHGYIKKSNAEICSDPPRLRLRKTLNSYLSNNSFSSPHG